MAMESYDDSAFRQVVNSADLVTPDGMPLVWVLQAWGEKKQKRVDGPNWMLHLCREAAAHDIPVAFYGSAPDTLQRLVVNLKSRFPSLSVVFAHAPPFRPLDIEEDKEMVCRLNLSGAKIIFVGLGCPKQERWMSEHKGKLMAVMIGVGAAFDFHAGILNRAPPWKQRM